MHRFYRIKIKIALKLTVFRHTKEPFFIENVEMDKKYIIAFQKVDVYLQKNHYGPLNIE